MYQDKIIIHGLNASLSKNDIVSLAFCLLQTCDKIASASLQLVELAKTFKDEEK